MIRKMGKEDMDLYLEMAEEFYHSDAVLHPVPDEYIRRTAAEALRSDEYVSIYMISTDGKDAGYAVTAKTFSQEAGGFVLWIEELYIRKEFRSRGLGREFFGYIEENKGEEVTRLRLEAEETNSRAISLYKNLGYRRLEYVQMIKGR